MGLIVLGSFLLLGGGGSFMWSAPKLDAVRSGAGQLSLGLTSLFNPQGAAQMQQEIQMYQTAYYGGIAALVVGGILLFAGIVQQAIKRPR